MTVAAVDLAPVCRKALKVICVSEDDRLTPATAADILAVNEAIAAGCRGVSRATHCPRVPRPTVSSPTKKASS